jgi:tyrosyl-tRNA synthetase
MDIEKRMDLIREVGEEIVTEQELRHLLQTKSRPAAYDGFEPSGINIHIAQGILRTININKMMKAGVRFKMLVADWFAFMNNKMGGDIEKIRKVGEYYIEVWKACGLKTDRIDFIWSDDLMKDKQHWETTVKIAKAASVKRIIRTSQIMGRKSGEGLSGAQIFYPCMQAADIYRLGCDITQLGMDQRKVNMLAREIGPKIGLWKPVVVSHHMILGLSKPQTASKDPADILLDLKMSKSKPDSAIFMEDSAEEISRKVRMAYCPAKETNMNPILEYCKYMVFEKFGEMTIDRHAKFGGAILLNSYEELENLFRKGELHPADLKNGVATHLDMMIAPVRKKLERNKKAGKLLNEIKSFRITR